MRRLTALAAGLLAAVCAAVVLLGVTREEDIPMLGGWGCLAIVSGSMEPALRAGDLVLVRREPAYFPGEIVVYSDNGLLVIHRLARLEGDKAVTRGDHNLVDDPPVESGALLGKARLVVPGLGKVLLFLQSPPGICTLLLLGCGILLFPLKKKM